MLKEKEVELFYNKVAKNYKEMHGKRFCDDLLEYFILKFLPQKKIKILDVGGGIGRFSIPLAKKGNFVVLSDISQAMLNEAKKTADKQKINNIQFVKESITEMKNQKNNSYDAVLVMNAILDYCGDHKQALREIRRVLKPNGVLIGSVNNRFKYCSENELKNGDFKLFKQNMRTGNRYIFWGIKEGHWTHEFTVDELKKDLQKSRFKIIKIMGIFNLLGKYDKPTWFSDENKKKELFNLQIQYAELDEYANNSSDYFFVAKKH